MAGSIRVVGGYDRKAHPEVVRKMITRGQSPVGNPAVMATEADRDEVCRYFDDLVWAGWLKHGTWSDEQLEWLSARVDEYIKGRDIELCCRCRNHADHRRCHGDTLRDLIIHLAEGTWFSPVTQKKLKTPARTG